MGTIAEISSSIDSPDAKEQVGLLRILPQHLKIPLDDLAWAKPSETSFEFWDNPEDAVYDQM
jgi:hypothetical protein